MNEISIKELSRRQYDEWEKAGKPWGGPRISAVYSYQKNLSEIFTETYVKELVEKLNKGKLSPKDGDVFLIATKQKDPKDCIYVIPSKNREGFWGTHGVGGTGIAGVGPMLNGKKEGEWWFCRGIYTKQVGHYKNNQRTGVWKTKKTVEVRPHWWSRVRYEQVFVEEATYKDDKLHGEYVSRHDNGKTSIKGNYKDGSKEGEWSYYNEDGLIWKKENYKEGLLHGEYVEYDEDRKVKTKGRYENGIKVGKWEHYDSITGEVREERFPETNNGTSTDTPKEGSTQRNKVRRNLGSIVPEDVLREDMTDNILKQRSRTV